MTPDDEILVHFYGGPLDGKRELVSRSNIVGGTIRTIKMGTVTVGPLSDHDAMIAPTLVEHEVVTYYVRRSHGGYSATLTPPTIPGPPLEPAIVRLAAKCEALHLWLRVFPPAEAGASPAQPRWIVYAYPAQGKPEDHLTWATGDTLDATAEDALRTLIYRTTQSVR